MTLSPARFAAVLAVAIARAARKPVLAGHVDDACLIVMFLSAVYAFLVDDDVVRGDQTLAPNSVHLPLTKNISEYDGRSSTSIPTRRTRNE